MGGAPCKCRGRPPRLATSRGACGGGRGNYFVVSQRSPNPQNLHRLTPSQALLPLFSPRVRWGGSRERRTALRDGTGSACVICRPRLRVFCLGDSFLSAHVGRPGWRGKWGPEEGDDKSENFSLHRFLDAFRMPWDDVENIVILTRWHVSILMVSCVGAGGIVRLCRRVVVGSRVSC